MAEWAEFDFDRCEWRIPAAHTKMRRPHRVPLPPQAIELLRQLEVITGRAALALPSVMSIKQPMSENTLNAALRRLGYGKDEGTAHGFRATASTLLNESGLWSADAIERQLGHVEGNDVRRAYARGEHWDERVKMMRWWANYVDELKADAGVVALRTRLAG
jgi:integrase